MKPYQDLTDQQWQQVSKLLPELNKQGLKAEETRGRPLCCTRAVLNGAMWTMFSGASWSSLPRRYPSFKTCNRRFKMWCDEGVMQLVAKELFGPSAEKFMALVRSRMRNTSARTHTAENSEKTVSHKKGMLSKSNDIKVEESSSVKNSTRHARVRTAQSRSAQV